MKKLFEVDDVDFVTGQWNGKLLPDSPDKRKKVDRVPVLVTAPND